MARYFDNNAVHYCSRSSTNYGLNGLTEFSLAFWINPVATTTPGGIVTVKEGSVLGAGTFASYFASGNLKLAGDLNNSDLSQNPVWTLSSALTAGTWVRFLFTWKRVNNDSTDGKIYINGSSQTVTFSAGGYTSAFVLKESSNNLWIGVEEVGHAQPPNAKVAWFTVWNRQLTSGEASTDYSDPRSVTSGMKQCVELCSDVDVSGNGLDVTPSSGITCVNSPKIYLPITSGAYSSVGTSGSLIPTGLTYLRYSK